MIGLACTAMLLVNAPDADYHGFHRIDWKCAGCDATLVEPKAPAKSHPWIWRAEFFDHRPMADLALLAKGFALGYINVGNTFGCPAAMEQFSAFYREVTRTYSLNRRVVLEGFSRGGLYVYNWAARNPDKVMAIYGDAPVCDFKTWPYGGQNAARSTDDWNALIRDYGFPNEAAALGYKLNPVDNLTAIAAAKIPILHVVGDKDSVLPVGPNTNLLQKRYRALGGLCEVIHKPEGDHHPHSLDDPTPIVDFILRHQDDTAKCKPATVIPAPNLESRYDSAGWNGRSWFDQHEDGIRAARDVQPRILLLGDSITQGFGGPGRQVSAPGKAAFDRYFGPRQAVSMGISGERTQNVLWRIQNGALDGFHPRFVSLLIGVNNRNDDSPAAVAHGIEKIVDAIHFKQPAAIVIVTKLFPTGPTPSSPDRAIGAEVNRRIEGLRKRSYVRMIDITKGLLHSDGTTNFELMAGDSLHLAPGGYEVWARRISEAIAKDELRRLGGSKRHGTPGPSASLRMTVRWG